MEVSVEMLFRSHNMKTKYIHANIRWINDTP